MRIFAVFILVASFFLASCATTTPTTIAANKSPNYVTQPKRIYGLVAIEAGAVQPAFGMERGLLRKYSQSFINQTTSILSNCEVAFSAANVVDTSKEGVADTAITEFHPDALMEITVLSYEKSGKGYAKSVTYDVKLIDFPTKKTVWRSNLKFNVEEALQPFMKATTFVEERGQTLAVILTNKMKEDKIFSSCAVISTKEKVVVN